MGERRPNLRTTEFLLICAAIAFAGISATQTVLCAGTAATECEFGMLGGGRNLALETLRIAGPLLLAGGWLVLVFSQPWRWWGRLLAIVPSALTLVDLGRSTRLLAIAPQDGQPSMGVMLGISAGIELSALVALLAILATRSRRPAQLPRVVLLLVAATSTGFLHRVVGGALAAAADGRSWADTLNGGYVTAAGILIPTLASMALGLTSRGRQDGPRPRPARTPGATRSLLIPELLLIAASGVIVWVTYLGWTPCAGSMLEGTQFDPTPHEWTFTQACHEAMDHGDGFPVSGWLESPLQRTVNGLNAIALLLLGVAWLMLVRNWGGLRRGVRMLLAALPGLLNLWLAGVAAVSFVWPPSEFPGLASVAMLAMDLAGVAAVVVLLASPAPGSASIARSIRVVLLALATTAASFGHLFSDYAFMVGFSEANWDSPPGSGYLTAFSIGLFAILSMIVGAVGRLRGPRPSRLVNEPTPVV
jgi:hypothetical protein